ncbi:unnamed protein product [Alopecurus aequalis]
MDKQSSREHSIVEDKGDASDPLVKPNLQAMQLQLLPHDVLRDLLSRLSIKDVVRMNILSREWRRLRICHPDLAFTKYTFSNSTTGNDEYQEQRVYDPKKLAWLAREFIINVEGSGCEKYKYVVPMCDIGGPNGSCVKSLDLGYVYLELPPSFCGIPNLKKLTLNMVSINGEDPQHFLLSCGLLESLSIDGCSSSSILRIPQELPRLQNLRVRHCEIKMIELHAPNLTKFEFDDDLVQTVLNYIFVELPAALPHVPTLLLLLTAIQVERFSSTPPLLEELEVHMDRDRYCSRNPRTVMAAQGPLHRRLRSVYISGFSDVSGLAEVALYILENAITLERMVVDHVAGMKEDLNSGRFYSVSKAGSSDMFVLPTEGTPPYCVDEKRMFAKNNLDKEEFRHILTIL